MGRDKALLELEGRALLDRASACLAEVCDEVLLACGPEERYGDRGLRLVLDPPDTEYGHRAGPLAGLHAVISAFPEQPPAHVAVLAVDIVGVTPELFRALEARMRERGADACLFATERGLEPLLAVYATSCREPMLRALRNGERRLISFHAGYGELKVAFLNQSELPPELGVDEPARNVNSPAEFLREGGAMP